MVVVLDVHVVFHLAIERQHLVVGPLVVAHGGPVVEVLGEAALHGLAVDGGTAADNLALGNVDFSLFLGNGAAQCPVVYGVLRFGVPGAAELDVVGQDRRVRVVVARLKQQHRGVGVFRQASGEGGAGSAAADNDNVVLHRYSLNRCVVVGNDSTIKVAGLADDHRLTGFH